MNEETRTPEEVIVFFQRYLNPRISRGWRTFNERAHLLSFSVSLSHDTFFCTRCSSSFVNRGQKHSILSMLRVFVLTRFQSPLCLKRAQHCSFRRKCIIAICGKIKTLSKYDHCRLNWQHQGKHPLVVPMQIPLNHQFENWAAPTAVLSPKSVLADREVQKICSVSISCADSDTLNWVLQAWRALME